MSLFLAKKQEDLNQKKVRDLLRLKENKKCFDCPTKSPFFVNTTLQTFICARCSGLVREVGHRVKAISASKFSGAELLALKQGGNGIALNIWLSNYSTHGGPEPESDDDVRAFMRQKYYETKWLDRALLASHQEKVRVLLAKQFTEDGLPIVTKSRIRLVSGFVRVPSTADNDMDISKNDDEDEEFGQDQFATAMPIPDCAPVTFNIPSFASPTGRDSMESEYSSFSAKSATSVQEDYVSSKRRSTVSSKRSVNSSRDSMDSNSSSATSSVSSSGANALSSEEIAERCRSSIESKDFITLDILPAYEEPKIEEPVITQVTVLPKRVEFAPINHNVSQAKIMPLQINVAQANRNPIPKYQYQHQLKSPVLENYGNGVQSAAPIHGNASASASPLVTPSISKPLPNSFDSIIMELSGLKLEKTVRRATYNGGVLSPAIVPLSPSSSTNALKTSHEYKASSSFAFDPSVFSHVVAETSPENDPYAALRGIPAPIVPVVAPVVEIKEQVKELDFPHSDEDDDDPWQEFCSSSSADEDKHIEAPAQVIQPIIEDKPVVAMDIFGDLDPLAMFRRF